MIAIVSTAPSRIVSCTSLSDSRMRRESSRMTASLMSGGICVSSSPTTARTASATFTVFAPEILSRSSATAGSPL